MSEGCGIIGSGFVFMYAAFVLNYYFRKKFKN